MRVSPCRTAGLQARFLVFAGSAQPRRSNLRLELRIFVDHTAHERHWSGALPAMSGPGGPRSGESLTGDLCAPYQPARTFAGQLVVVHGLDAGIEGVAVARGA